MAGHQGHMVTHGPWLLPWDRGQEEGRSAVWIQLAFLQYMGRENGEMPLEMTLNGPNPGDFA